MDWLRGSTPHIVQYQGSKRLLASQILRHMPSKFQRLIEPFAGMAAVSIATAKERRAEQYWMNDLNEPIVRLVQAAVETPVRLIERYTEVWEAQFSYEGDHVDHYYHVRSLFNAGAKSVENMLYLLARCVKGAVRYGSNGCFNQSPDKRRHGTNPRNIAANVHAISGLLKGRTAFSAMDYRDVLSEAKPGDLVYMDPPYQGVSNVRDHRYIAGVDFLEFADSIKALDRKSIDYIISYDGTCGGKKYGEHLPDSLGCQRYALEAGLSTQSTLLGRTDTTFETLYVSNGLVDIVRNTSHQMSFGEVAI